jgi:hypothetical protein
MKRGGGAHPVKNPTLNWPEYQFLAMEPSEDHGEVVRENKLVVMKAKVTTKSNRGPPGCVPIWASDPFFNGSTALVGPSGFLVS